MTRPPPVRSPPEQWYVHVEPEELYNLRLCNSSDHPLAAARSGTVVPKRAPPRLGSQGDGGRTEQPLGSSDRSVPWGPQPMAEPDSADDTIHGEESRQKMFRLPSPGRCAKHQEPRFRPLVSAQTSRVWSAASPGDAPSIRNLGSIRSFRHKPKGLLRRIPLRRL